MEFYSSINNKSVGTGAKKKVKTLQDWDSQSKTITERKFLTFQKQTNIFEILYLCLKACFYLFSLITGTFINLTTWLFECLYVYSHSQCSEIFKCMVSLTVVNIQLHLVLYTEYLNTGLHTTARTNFNTSWDVCLNGIEQNNLFIKIGLFWSVTNVILYFTKVVPFYAFWWYPK